MPAGDAGARRRRRLSRSGEFERVYREGSSGANRYLVLHSFPRAGTEGAGGAGDEIRLGVSVGRKVGGAVERNRVKRVLREAFWSLAEVLPPEHDFVLVARPDITEVCEREGMTGVRREIQQALIEVSGEDRKT